MSRLLLFDVDGTLVDVDGAGRAALRDALTEVYGRTGPIDSFDFHGKTDPAIVHGLLTRAGLSEPEIEEGIQRLWRSYLRGLERQLEARRSADRVRPCPGVLELLDRLEREERFVLALVTGNVEEGARHKLRAGGLDGRFRFGAYGSDSARRPDLPPLAMRRARRRLGRTFRPDEVWVIGDTPEDIGCGRASGLRTLAVATGRHGVEELRAHGADAVVAELSPAEEIVELLGG